MKTHPAYADLRTAGGIVCRKGLLATYEAADRSTGRERRLLLRRAAIEKQNELKAEAAAHD